MGVRRQKCRGKGGGGGDGILNWTCFFVHSFCVEIITTRAVVLDLYLHYSVISKAELAYNNTETSVERNIYQCLQ